MKKASIFFVALLLLSLFSYITTIRAQDSPLAVAGYVYFYNGTAVPDGTAVTVYNEDNGLYVNTTVGLGTGMYTSTIMAENGDVINISATADSETGYNTSTADLSIVTMWINLTFTLAGMAPTARFTYSPDNPLVDELVTFHDYSTDPDGTIIGWNWDYGDGETHVGKSASHRYGEVRDYTVELTVTDNDGFTDTAKKTVNVSVEEDEGPSIPDLKPPLYTGFTIPEMYQLMRGDQLGVSNEEIIVVVIDTGTTPRMFNDTDMTDIEVLYHPSYSSGIDDNGHGTFVNAIVHYALEQWAPNSVQYSIKALDENGASTPSVFLESLDMAKDLHPHIITISAGIIGNPDDVFCRKIDELRSEGIIVTVAAGNLGPTPSTILSPACGASALAIGAIDPRWKTVMDRSDDRVCVWSSRGPVLNIVPKPDMTAPGESIIGPWKYGETVTSGTSLSTPFVAGGVLLIYANNKFMLDAVKTTYGLFGMGGLAVTIVEDSLAEGCLYKGNMDDYGWGIVDIEKANSAVFLKCFLWLLLFFSIVAIIIVIIILLLYYKKYPEKKEAIKKKLTGSKYL